MSEELAELKAELKALKKQVKLHEKAELLHEAETEVQQDVIQKLKALKAGLSEDLCVKHGVALCKQTAYCRGEQK